MKKIWLDLEIVGDIDDAVTLIFAIETNSNIKAVSLLNPSKEELSFVRYWLDFSKKDITLFTHYDKKVKNNNKTHPLIMKYQNEDYPVYTLNDVTDTQGYVVLGGGAYTIPNLLREKGFDSFVLQGGFAGTNVCKRTILEKFEDKEKCRSFNPNIDIKATREMIDSQVKIVFISKDICHDSGINIDFVKTINYRYTKDFLLQYLDESTRYKMMHDLVAFLYIIDNTFIETTKVSLNEDNRQWFSKHSEFSKKEISIDWNKETFLNLLRG